MECMVCLDAYDPVLHRPKVLPCGHTICLECLQHPDFGGKCPQDRKAFTVRPVELPDNISVLNTINEGSYRVPLWCRECCTLFQEGCADGAHKPCSLKQLRSEAVGPQLEQLQLGLASSRQVGQLLADLGRDVARLQQQHELQQRALEDALQRLRVADKEVALLQGALPAAATQVEKVPMLESSAHLAAVTGTVTVTVQEEGRGARGTWRGSLKLDSQSDNIVRHLLVTLCTEGILNKEGATSQKVANKEAELDVSNLCRIGTSPQDLTQVLQQRNLKEVLALTGLDCSVHPHWSHLLLEGVAQHLTELHMSHPTAGHLNLLQQMKALRSLSLTCSARTAASPLPKQLLELNLRGATFEQMQEVSTMMMLRKLSVECTAIWKNAPALPLQLEEVEIVNASETQLTCLTKMTGLKRLALHRCHFDGSLAFKENGSRLQWLSLGLKAPTTLMSIISGHASMVEELHISCASAAGGTYFFDNLAHDLESCKFQQLTRVLLLRKIRGASSLLLHDKNSCRLQLQTLSERLLRKNGEGGLDVVEVLCDRCRNC